MGATPLDLQSGTAPAAHLGPAPVAPVAAPRAACLYFKASRQEQAVALTDAGEQRAVELLSARRSPDMLAAHTSTCVEHTVPVDAHLALLCAQPDSGF